MADKPHIEKLTVKEGSKQTDIVIGMTDKEGQDRSFVEDMRLSATEKTREELRKRPESNTSPEKRQALAQELKEYKAFQMRKSQNTKRYF